MNKQNSGARKNHTMQLEDINITKNLPNEHAIHKTIVDEVNFKSVIQSPETFNLQNKSDYEGSTSGLDSEFHSDSESNCDESNEEISSKYLEVHKKIEINYRMGRIKINLNKFSIQYECLICLNDFENFKDFSAPEHTEDKNHIACSNIEMDVQDINDNYVKICGEIYSSKYPRKYSLICFLCQAEIIDYDEILSHMKVKHPMRYRNLEFKYYRCNQCEEIYSEIEKLEDHVKIHPVMKPFKCSYCKSPAFFKTPNFLYKHEQSHIDKLFKNKCELCGKFFSSPTTLRTHITIVHEGKKDFKCNLCEKKFGHPRSLQYHNRTHTGELPYQCQLCGRRFIVKRCLLTHLTTHSKEKAYECKSCDKCFSTSSALLQHNKAFHMSEEIGKKYKCSECSKSYVAKYQLKLHNELKHSPLNKTYKCFECDKIYFHKFNLKMHTMNCHQESGVFPCKECDKIFDLKRRLKQHIKRVHNTVNTCELCGLTLKSKYNFEKHRKNCDGTIDHKKEKLSRNSSSNKVLSESCANAMFSEHSKTKCLECAA